MVSGHGRRVCLDPVTLVPLLIALLLDQLLPPLLLLLLLLPLPLLPPFCFLFFETAFLCAALAILELTL